MIQSTCQSYRGTTHDEIQEGMHNEEGGTFEELKMRNRVVDCSGSVTARIVQSARTEDLQDETWSRSRGFRHPDRCEEVGPSNHIDRTKTFLHPHCDFVRV
jgi:hypothetical protein